MGLSSACWIILPGLERLIIAAGRVHCAVLHLEPPSGALSGSISTRAGGQVAPALTSCGPASEPATGPICQI